MEEDRGNFVLHPNLRLQARAFQDPSGRWAVRPGAVVWYGTERSGSIEVEKCLSVDTGETRPTYEAVVEWLQTKTRRAVGEVAGLNEQQKSKLVINSEIDIDE